MQLKVSFLLLAALAPFTMARPATHERPDAMTKRADWTSTPSGSKFSSKGFGGRTEPAGGSIDTYHGNVGKPWGSNIIQISESDASQYKYVAQIKGKNTEPWNVVFWNKFGPDGKLDGHYGRSALSFTLSPGETKYVAFDENTQGGFGAAEGSLPTGTYGAYSCTWGEFDFGNRDNNEWSGFDVSAIQAQMSGHDVQGMKICDARGSTCSSISKGGKSINNAYSKAETDIGGIGGNLQNGPVRLSVVIDYDG